jgi:hypothetical protein
LAQAVGYEAIKMNFQVLYRSIFDLVRDFMKDEAFSQQDRTLRRYLNPELLIIDDFGLKQLPKNSGEHLFEVIMRRYENRSTIMTSNRPLEEWGKLLGDVPTAGAILDRFLHHAQTIAITGRSYRLKDHAAIAGKEDKNKKDQIQVQRTFDRRTGELNGSLSGSARFTSLLTAYGKCSIFTSNRPYWPQHFHLQNWLELRSAGARMLMRCLDR